jgi:hypothetical protein
MAPSRSAAHPRRTSASCWLTGYDVGSGDEFVRDAMSEVCGILDSGVFGIGVPLTSRQVRMFT